MAGEHLIILGPPGAGKGTQAVKLARELGLKHLSTGDLLREAISRGTELGRRAEDFLERGVLVPDGIIIDLIADELLSLKDGWILDGFPRTLPQAEALTEMLSRNGESIDFVLQIEVDPEIVVKRSVNRRICNSCGALYNLSTLKENEGSCEKCGGKLVRRVDDEEDTIRHRLEVYKEQTAPVVDYYRRNGEVITVDGAGEINEITAEFIRAIT
ncbi:MAG: adenylate kinase [Candidatus Krumholzibacteriota bacterium]|nr:adenylate kinase [Candidatus Krumholzibacteriota bacterium]